MLKYNRKVGGRPKRNPVEVGEIVHILPKSPEIVEAWHTRTYAAARRGPDGKWIDTRMVGGHLATLRNLRTGHRRTLADHWLRLAVGFYAILILGGGCVTTPQPSRALCTTDADCEARFGPMGTPLTEAQIDSLIAARRQ